MKSDNKNSRQLQILALLLKLQREFSNTSPSQDGAIIKQIKLAINDFSEKSLEGVTLQVRLGKFLQFINNELAFHEYKPTSAQQGIIESLRSIYNAEPENTPAAISFIRGFIGM